MHTRHAVLVVVQPGLRGMLPRPAIRGFVGSATATGRDGWPRRKGVEDDIGERAMSAMADGNKTRMKAFSVELYPAAGLSRDGSQGAGRIFYVAAISHMRRRLSSSSTD